MVSRKNQPKKRRRLEIKQNTEKLKSKFGGKCKKCGYDRCIEALEFHHTDPKTKDRGKRSINYILRNYSYGMAMKEAKKCVLVCANCHREIHNLKT